MWILGLKGLKKTSMYGIDPVADPDAQKSGGPVIQILR